MANAKIELPNQLNKEKINQIDNCREYTKVKEGKKKEYNIAHYI